MNKLPDQRSSVFCFSASAFKSSFSFSNASLIFSSSLALSLTGKRIFHPCSRFFRFFFFNPPSSTCSSSPECSSSLTSLTSFSGLKSSSSSELSEPKSAFIKELIFLFFKNFAPFKFHVHDFVFICKAI